MTQASPEHLTAPYLLQLPFQNPQNPGQEKANWASIQRWLNGFTPEVAASAAGQYCTYAYDGNNLADYVTIQPGSFFSSPAGFFTDAASIEVEWNGSGVYLVFAILFIDTMSSTWVEQNYYYPALPITDLPIINGTSNLPLVPTLTPGTLCAVVPPQALIVSGSSLVGIRNSLGFQHSGDSVDSGYGGIVKVV